MCKASQNITTKGNKGNTILKFSVDNVQTLENLDMGLEDSTVTKEAWDKWGKKAFVKAHIGLFIVF